MFGLVQYLSSSFNAIRGTYNNPHFTVEELEVTMAHGL